MVNGARVRSGGGASRAGGSMKGAGFGAAVAAARKLATSLAVDLRDAACRGLAAGAGFGGGGPAAGFAPAMLAAFAARAARAALAIVQPFSSR